MANQVIGQIVSIGQVQNLTSKKGNSFQKRDIVISIRRYDPNTGQPVTDWENTPKLSFMGEKCRELDRFQVGQMVAISFDLQGTSYQNANGETDIITEARPYKIELYGQRQPQQPVAQAAPAPAYPQQPMQMAQPAKASQPVQQPQQPQQPQQYSQQPQGFQEPF